MDPSIWNTRAVIVHRDDNGYGLTVSGDNPVNVQTIKKDGAADRAGIREGDIILKVNGTLVEHMNHTEVVNLIR
ncbi:Rho guanine nucleotide exchange factor 12, partial [Orchesella cincta]